MSRHHRAQKWSTDSPKFRAQIKPMLPLPCVECGRPVFPTDQWHVGHRPGHEAERGRRARLADVGPVHARCNLSSGGRRGATITNSRRTQRKDIRPW